MNIDDIQLPPSPRSQAIAYSIAAEVSARNWHDRTIRLLEISLNYRKQPERSVVEIMTKLNLLIEDYPENARLYQNLAICRAKMRHFQMAAENYTKAIEIDPFLPGVYLDRGYCYMCQHQKKHGRDPVPSPPPPSFTVGPVGSAMADLLQKKMGAKPAPSLWDLYPDLHLAIGDFSVAIHYGTAIMDRKYHKPELPYLYRGACYGLLGNDR